VGDGVLLATIEEEQGKLNLNDLVTQPDAKVREVRISRLKRLFELLRIDIRLVDAIVDWVDADDIPEPQGAETVYYRSLSPPYRAANGAFNTLGELRLVKGFSDDLVRRLSHYVTVYPSKPDGMININTADAAVIEALDKRITPSMAQAVVQARPFRSIQDLDRVSGLEKIGKELRMTSAYSVRSDHFSTFVTARVGDVGRSVRAVIQRSNATGETALLLLRFEE
jgi:general secretion pathway protein K